MMYHLTLTRMSIIKNLKTITTGEDAEKREPPYTAGRSVNWDVPYEEYGGSLKN